MTNLLLSIKRLLGFTLAILCSTNTFAQAPAIEWQQTYGGFEADFMNIAIITDDGGYLFGGDSYSSLTGNKTDNSNGANDYWVIKTDANGNIEWQNAIGGAAYDVLYDAHQTSDGGFILGGYSSSGISGDKTESNLGEQDYWVIKLSNSGTIEWQNSLRTNKNDMCTSLHPTDDGGYIIGGFSSSLVNGDKTTATKGLDDFWILKLDATGNISWQKTIGGSSTDMLVTIRQTTDGGYIVGGSSISNASADKTENSNGAYDFWIMKLNSTGNIVWQNTIGGSDMDALSDVIQTNDDGYLIGGYSSSGISGDKTEACLGLDDYWVLKLDNAGNIIWQNTIGGSARDVLTGLHQTADNGYIINGYTPSGISGDKSEACFGGFSYGDYWILKLDESGNIIWQKTIGGTGEDLSGGLDITIDGSIIISGTSMSPISGNKTTPFYGIADFWAIKLTSDCVPADEVCNGIDDDCDGMIDNDVAMFAVAYPDGATSVCQGNTVLLIAEYSGDDIQWIRNGVEIPGATGDTYSANKTGFYACVTSSICGSITSGTVPITINKNPIANIIADGPTTFCAGGSVTLTETPSAGCTYQWYKGASAIGGATSNTYLAVTSGNYKCRVTKTATGCFKNSPSIPVNVTCKENMGDLQNFINIFPNPANELITIQLPNSENNEIIILDALGNHVLEQVITFENNTINISKLPSGLYFVVTNFNGISSAEKLIKQ